MRFEEGQLYFESGLRKVDGSTNRGAFDRAVRPISDLEYQGILLAGFAHILETESPARTQTPYGVASEPSTFARPIIERLIARPFRDAAFSTAVKAAYEDTCAVTGIKIINGGGRSEVQAAHIRPVSHHGSDSVRNGIALCGTVHWMFDRGLISIGDDYEILISDGKVPDAVMLMVNQDTRLKLPRQRDLYPYQKFLKYHRETVFKG